MDVYSNNANEELEQNGQTSNGHDANNSTDVQIEPAQTGNGEVISKEEGSVKIEKNSKIYASLEIEKPEQRIRSKSIYHKYQQNVSNKYKSLIANLVSTLMILILWGLFMVPSAVLVWSLIDYYLNRIDPLSNDTVAMVFNADVCTNVSLQTAKEEFTRVAQGGYNTTNFSCITTFVSNGSQCVPECLAQYPGGDVYYYLSFVTVPIFSFITLVAAAFGASTWLCLKNLWKFPHIISFYLIVCVFGQALMIFAGSIDRKRFYCSSRDIFASQASPTVQCQIQGPLFHFFLLAFLLWYMCDIFNIVYVILYPMKANMFFKHSLKIHILQSFISWGVPLLIVGTILAATRGYHIYTYPILCYPDQIVLLAAYYIPGVVFSLASGTGIILFGLTLYKRQYSAAQTSTNNVYRSLLLQLIIYTVALSTQLFIIVVEFTITSANQKISDVLEQTHSYCITALHRTPECCAMSYRFYSVPFFNFLNETAICSWGIVALSVVSVREAKTMWKRILTCSKCRRAYHEHVATSTTN